MVTSRNDFKVSIFEIFLEKTNFNIPKTILDSKVTIFKELSFGYLNIHNSVLLSHNVHLRYPECRYFTQLIVPDIANNIFHKMTPVFSVYQVFSS